MRGPCSPSAVAHLNVAAGCNAKRPRAQRHRTPALHQPLLPDAMRYRMAFLQTGVENGQTTESLRKKLRSARRERRLPQTSLKKSRPDTAPILWEQIKKSQPDEGWDFTVCWTRQELGILPSLRARRREGARGLAACGSKPPLAPRGRGFNSRKFEPQNKTAHPCGQAVSF